MRIARTMVGAALVVVVAAPFAVAQSPRPGTGCARLRGGWEQIAAPDFPSGDRKVASFTAGATDPDRLVVTNGVSVMTTADGGCTWGETFALPATPTATFPFSSSDARITSVVGSVPPVDTPLMYLTVEQLDRVGRPHVVVSVDGGETWQSGDQGLEAAAGSPLHLAVAPSDPRVVYLLTGVTSGSGAGLEQRPLQSLFVSADGGASWSKRADFVAAARELQIDLPRGSPVIVVDGSFDGVAVDGLDPDELWLYGPAGLWHSSDGAVNVAQVDGVPRQSGIGAVDVFHAANAPARVLAFESDTPTVYRSDDGGEDFFSFTGPGVTQSAVSFTADLYSLATDGGVFILDPRTLAFEDVSPADGRPILDLRAAFVPATTQRTGTFPAPTLLGRNDSAVELFAPPPPAPPPEPEPIDVELIPGMVDLDDPRLDPRRTKIVLDEGESKTVGYELVLPRQPTPLDVYFLIDISGSMDDTIRGVQRAMASIAEQLVDAGIDAWFGVGEYRSYTDGPAYHRVRDVGGPDEGLGRALESLFADGGGRETQLAALLQTATGEGQEGDGAYIEPNQQANFRPGTLRVVINATDEEFSEGGPHPTYEETIAALTSKKVLQVGLAIQDDVADVTGKSTDGGLQDAPKVGLDRVAKGTGARAPLGGVDCDGDGAADLEFGEPLVCAIDPEDAEEASVMAPAIVNVLKAVTDIAAVDLRPVGDTDNAEQVIAGITPGIVPNVNFKEFHRLDFEVTYTCPDLDERTRFPVDLAATARGRPLAGARALVLCRVPERPVPPPEAEPPQAPAAAAVVPLAPLAPPPARPPEPVPQPNPLPQAQVNPATQAQAQPGVAAQEEEQPQLAPVTVPVGEAGAEQAALNKTSEQYAMSTYRERQESVPPPEFLYAAGAISMAFVFGWAMAQRERTQSRRTHR